MSDNSFLHFCTTLESISSRKGKSEKLPVLRKLVNTYSRGIPFYNVLRLLIPDAERERGPYRLGESTFTKTLTNILCLPPTGSDINLLKNYNQSASGVAAKLNDYADAAYTVVCKRTNAARAQTYDMTEINNKLDAIASGNIRKQETIIYDLFMTLSHVEIKWLIRILLRELKLGLGKKDVLLCYHPDAEKYFSFNNSLRQLCVDLEDRNKSASDIEITLFNAFRPMLSLRCDIKEFNRVANDAEEYYVEEKFDGERFQLHYSEDKGQGKYKYFSRNGYDFTEEFTAHAQTIQGCLNAKSVILDGEMMIYYKSTKKFGSKGMSADIKKVKSDSNIQQCLCVFDIVFYNGRNWSRKSLQERKELLKKVVRPLEGVLMVSGWKTISTKQEILDELNSSMDRKQEGIVFKSPDGQYLPGERIGWWKVKLEYFEGVMSDLDVLVLGGYYGQGATKGEITGYLVGVKNRAKYLAFAKIATGLTREDTRKLNKALDPFWKDVHVNDEHEKYGVVWGKEKPDKWIPPRHSHCLLVRGSELIKIYDSSSTKYYATKYTLRFPRILGLRMDKPFDECLTEDELNGLTEGSAIVQKLNKRHLELSDLQQTAVVKRRKKVLSFGRLPVDVVSDILQSYSFVVLSGLGDWNSELVIKAIRENSGTVAIECTDSTLCMLVGDDHLRTKTYKGEVDIVHVSWLRNVLNEGEFMMYEPSDIVYMSEKSRRRFKQEFDKFGDGYIQPAERRSLMKIFNKIRENKQNMHPTVEEINEFHTEINLPGNWKPLRGYVAYFDRFKIINDPNSTELHQPNVEYFQQVEFKTGGGIVSQFLDADCDCVIASPARFEEVEVYLRSVGWDIPICSSVEEFQTRILQQQS